MLSKKNWGYITSSLFFLSKGKNNISEFNYDIISFLSNSILNIRHNKNLTPINFTNYELTEDNINYISNFSISRNAILYYNKSKNALSDKEYSQFFYCILKPTSLEYLVMNECGINGDTFPFLFNKKRYKYLQKFI